MDSGVLLSVIFGGLLALFSLAVVGYSFLRGTGAPDAAAASDDAGASVNDSSELPLESLYDSLETLQLEYRLGNLPESEYREQYESYRRQAAAIIKRQLESGAADPELRLEAEVLARRGLLPQPAPADEFETGPPPSAAAANARPDDTPPPVANDSDTDNAPDSPGDGQPSVRDNPPPAASDNDTNNAPDSSGDGQPPISENDTDSPGDGPPPISEIAPGSPGDGQPSISEYTHAASGDGQPPDADAIPPLDAGRGGAAR